MTAIQLASLFTDRLNLNGDQANLFVIQKRLSWLGFESEIKDVRSAAQLAVSNASFLFLGHGSLAAWEACLGEWPTLSQDFLAATASTAAMAVASASDLLLQAATGVAPEFGPNMSAFEVEKLGELSVLGYKNTSQLHSESQQVGNLLLTWLHGPLLAKNPSVADEQIRRILGASAPGDLSNANTRKIDEIVAGIWKLEASDL